MQVLRPLQQGPRATRKRSRSSSRNTGDDQGHAQDDFTTPTQRTVRPRRASTDAGTGGAFHTRWDHLSRETEEKERQVYGKKTTCATQTMMKKKKTKVASKASLPASSSSSSRRTPVTRSASRKAPVTRSASRKAQATKTKETKTKTRGTRIRTAARGIAKTKRVGAHVRDLTRFFALLDAAEMLSAEHEDLVDDANDILPCLQLLRDGPAARDLRRKRSPRIARM